MKNYSILEDLAQDNISSWIKKNHTEILTESLLRNFNLIRRYAHSEDQTNLVKFKKNLIPKCVRQLTDFTQTFQNKHKPRNCPKRIFPNERIILLNKNKENRFEIDQLYSLNQQSHKSTTQARNNTLNFTFKTFLDNQSHQYSQCNFENDLQFFNGPKQTIKIFKKQQQKANEINLQDPKSPLLFKNLHNESVRLYTQKLKQINNESVFRKNQQNLVSVDRTKIKEISLNENTLNIRSIKISKQRKQAELYNIRDSSGLDSKKQASKYQQKENNRRKNELELKQTPKNQKQSIKFGFKAKIPPKVRPRIYSSCVFKKQNYFNEIEQNKERKKKQIVEQKTIFVKAMQKVLVFQNRGKKDLKEDITTFRNRLFSGSNKINILSKFY